MRDSGIEHVRLDDLVQDVNEPVWPSEPVEPAVGETFDPGHAHHGLRTLGGIIDLLHDVEEDLTSWISDETMAGVGHRPPRRQAKPLIVETHERAPTSVRFTTYAVNQEMPVCMDRDDRVRVIVTNWGPGIVYISHDTGSGLNEPQANVAQIPPPGPDATITGRQNWREIRSTAKLYVFPTTGQTAIVDVQDEYGEPRN